jgi:hypothetical protein
MCSEFDRKDFTGARGLVINVIECYGTVRVESSYSIENTMDNGLTYSVRNQDVV